MRYIEVGIPKYLDLTEDLNINKLPGSDGIHPRVQKM